MPEYRLVAPLQWRALDDRVLLRDPARGADVALHPQMRPLLEALPEGAPIAALAALLPVQGDERRERRNDARVRRFLFNLHRMGYVEIPVDAPPASIGRYDLVKELGRGGVGVAYLCRDRETGEEVVVKRAWDFLQPYSVTEASMRREAEVMRALDHPGIARYHDAIELGGHLHLVREFLRGEELLAYAGRGIGDAAERRRIALGVADILAHLHERGYILLDARPANFLLREGTRAPALLDVGQCRALVDGRVPLPRKVGSQGFVAPEIVPRREATARTDVWGLSRLLYFLGTGQLPAEDATLDMLVARAPAEDCDALRRLGADSPEARPATMREAARFLAADKV